MREPVMLWVWMLRDGGTVYGGHAVEQSGEERELYAVRTSL
jgi:hypothetical protein